MISRKNDIRSFQREYGMIGSVARRVNDLHRPAVALDNRAVAGPDVRIEFSVGTFFQRIDLPT